MKKIISILFLLFSFYIFSFIPSGNAESVVTKFFQKDNSVELELAKKIAVLEDNYTVLNNNYTILKNKYTALEDSIRIESLVRYVESESEIIIPNYVDTKYVEYTFNLANKLNLSTRMVFRLMYKESCFVDTIVSPKGAKGLMQLMPITRRSKYNELRVDTLGLDRNQEDIYISLNILKDEYDFWHSKGKSNKKSWELVLASYNAGNDAVRKYNGIPPYKETKDFVAFILKPHSNLLFFANNSRKYENKIKDNS